MGREDRRARRLSTTDQVAARGGSAIVDLDQAARPGRASQWRVWLHVGCYDDCIARHQLTGPPLEQVRWRVGQRVSVIAAGQVRRGTIVALAGPMVRVDVGRDQAPVMVEPRETPT